MSRKITLNIKGGSDKQYSTLVVELGLIAQSWRKFGVTISLPEQERTLAWGKRKYNKDEIRAEIRH